MLKSAGVDCWGDQESITGVHGHFLGHIDGKCRGVQEDVYETHLLEIKTMSDKNFKDINKKKLKQSKPVYFAQTQIYMKKLKLNKCLFIAVNKNDDSLYIEIINFDEGFADDLERKAEIIILSDAPPKKEYKPTWYECKWCSAKEICHKDMRVEVNCRTCTSCDILPEGKWECSKHGIPLTTEQQRVGCSHHAFLECFIKD